MGKIERERETELYNILLSEKLKIIYSLPSLVEEKKKTRIVHICLLL
jgi:hypothetical protein